MILPLVFHDQEHIIKMHVIPEEESVLILGVDYFASDVPGLLNIPLESQEVFIQYYENSTDTEKSVADGFYE